MECQTCLYNHMYMLVRPTCMYILFALNKLSCCFKVFVTDVFWVHHKPGDCSIKDTKESTQNIDEYTPNEVI